jgi:hypothetical protein
MLKTRKALADLQAARKALFRSAYAERNANKEADAALKRIEAARGDLEVALTEELAELDRLLDAHDRLVKQHDAACQNCDFRLLDDLEEPLDEARRHIIGGLR